MALQELLSIFNSSFSFAHCPQIGRVAIIIPLLKARNLPLKSPRSVLSVSRHVLSNFWNAFLMSVATISLKPATCSANSKPVFIKTELWRSDYSSSSSAELLCIDTSWFQQSIRYGLERKTNAPHLRHWHSFYIHPLYPIFLQWLQGTSSMSLVPVNLLLKVYLKVPSSSRYSSCST